MEIVANITEDQSGAPLTNTGLVGNPANTSRTWNDAVLVEVSGLMRCLLPITLQ